MKRIITYSILILLLAACSADGPEPPCGADDAYRIKFVFNNASFSRGDYYSRDIPGNEIAVSSYFTDNFGESQEYFTNLKASTETAEGSGIYAIDGWYWPLQGQMQFLGWWIDGGSGSATFTEKEMPDGTKLPVLNVEAHNLNGLRDFVYGVTGNINCPSSDPVSFTLLHALASIDIQLYAQVFDDDGVTYNEAKTVDLISKLSVHKVYLEKCALKGDAAIMPGGVVEWTIPSTYIKDQLARKRYDDSPQSWLETSDAAADNTSFGYLPVTKWTEEANHIRRLVVPQQKTAIVVEYLVKTLGSEGEVNVTHTTRFELGENGKWLPGGIYNYKIIFRNISDTTADPEMIASWSEVLFDPTNNSLVYNSIGNLPINSHNTSVIIDPVHDGGSMTGDDMDYKNGGVVF